MFIGSLRPPELIPAKSWLAILEIFIHQHDLESAYNTFQQLKSTPISNKINPELQKYQSLIFNHGLVVLGAGNLTILESDFSSFFSENQKFPILALSQGNYQVLEQLFNLFTLKNDLEEINSLEDFSKNVLEHCYAPWIVIENIYTWLSYGAECSENPFMVFLQKN